MQHSHDYHEAFNEAFCGMISGGLALEAPKGMYKQ